MKTLALLLYIVVSILSLNASALPSNRYGYLHKTTDEVLEIRRKAVNPSDSDIAGIASRVCSTLTVLLDKDPNFRKDLERLSADSSKNMNYHRQLADDLIFFIDAFLPEENEYLLKSGVSPYTASQILIAAGMSRNSLREPLPAATVLGNIERLRSQTCEGAKALAQAQENQNAQSQRRRTLTKWALGLGGVSLIAADAVFAVPSGGVATASFTLGGAGVGAAVAQ